METDRTRRARLAGRELGADHGIAERLRPYEAHRWQPWDTARPVLQLDDVSAIPFLVDIAGVEEYQHRGRLRAGDRDVYVTVTPAIEGYEAYCRDTLGLGAPEHLVADPVGPPIQVALACANGRARARLVGIARDARGMTIHPYMGIEEVWELAAVLSVDSGIEVRVMAPPPPVTWIANDKAVFSELVTRVLGREALVETRVARDADTIESDLRTLARRHPRVGLKRTRCASAMGNAVFWATEVQSKRDASRAVQKFLHRTEWPEGEEVLAVAWLETDLSPSTQLWIPPLGLGEPRLDGIYEQILEGEHKVFVGSRPSSLPHAVNEALATSALLVAAALQELGYVGRCSFDHLVTGNPKGDFQALLMECNGRWGGTSTPMSLLDRLLPGPRPSYRAQDVVFPSLIGARLPDLLELVGELLFRAESGHGRFILYNLGPLSRHGKFDVISIGADQRDAERGVTELLPKRLGL
ncbi:MAG: hypothetical protein AMS21_01520 [Gemmatimonas sp. SG8_38_2]|nr:MAG: hypothetical protein AMS21_01520 [Gemmatimonas sp. SG8_38_2]